MANHDEAYRFSEEYGRLCGACQKWGCYPYYKDGKCEICNRTPEQILKEHGPFTGEMWLKILKEKDDIVSEHVYRAT